MEGWSRRAVEVRRQQGGGGCEARRQAPKCLAAPSTQQQHVLSPPAMASSMSSTVGRSSYSTTTALAAARASASLSAATIAIGWPTHVTRFCKEWGGKREEGLGVVGVRCKGGCQMAAGVSRACCQTAAAEIAAARRLCNSLSHRGKQLFIMNRRPDVVAARHVCRSVDTCHAGHGRRRGGFDAQQARVGAGGEHEGGMERVGGQLHVVHVQRGTGDLRGGTVQAGSEGGKACWPAGGLSKPHLKGTAAACRPPPASPPKPPPRRPSSSHSKPPLLTHLFVGRHVPVRLPHHILAGHLRVVLQPVRGRPLVRLDGCVGEDEAGARQG